MANLATGIGGAASGVTAGAAVGGPIGAGIGGAIGLLGGLFGGSDNSDQIAQLQQEAANLYNTFGPVDLSNPITFQQFQQAGILSPQMEQALNLQMQQKAEIQENPENRAQQEQSLAALKQLSQRGLSEGDLAAFRQLQNQVAGDTEAKRQQILQEQQQRGQAGSGATLAAQLMGAQSGAQSESQQADQLAQQAAAARQNALGQLFQGQSQIRSQDYATQQQNMQNELLRRQFLDTNAMGRQQRNVAAQNQANLYNTMQAQNVSNQNTAMSNQELLRQQQAKEQYFQDQMAMAQGKANALTGQANYLQGRQNASAQGLQNIFSGVGQLGTAISGMNGGQPLFGGSSSSPISMPTMGSSSGYGSAPTNSQFGGLGGNYQFSHGGRVKGPEIVHGDNPMNDIINAKLSAGETVLPKSVSKSPSKAAKFVKEENEKDKKHEHANDMLKTLSDLLKKMHEMSK